MYLHLKLPKVGSSPSIPVSAVEPTVGLAFSMYKPVSSVEPSRVYF